ncbi:MAG: hypothetical protein WAU78_02145 [Roseiarcus sp.]
MRDPITILRAKKAKILADAQREADALDADVRKLKELSSLADKYGFALIEKDNGQLAPDGAADEGIVVDLDGPSYKAAISASEQALKAANQPLELSELFDACESVGVKLGGKRPQSTLSAFLSHESSTVESISKGVYWLKGVPVPP